MMTLLDRRVVLTFLCLAILLIGMPGAASPAARLEVSVAGRYEEAARQNPRLMQQMNWYFGGKSQRGWGLYVPLIQRLIGTDADPVTPEFALALSNWQSRLNLGPTGILDFDTWMAMVSTFQAQRLRHHSRTATGKLFLAPADDFYDQSRPLELRYVDAQAYLAYQRLYAAAKAELGVSDFPSNFLKIVSAYRSPAYQAALRKRSPNSGRAGLAVNSPHFTGRALDLYVGGEPVSTADWNRRIQIDTPVYRWLVKHAHEYGFYPYFYEPWHWEYRGM